jgi:hypothetical protein
MPDYGLRYSYEFYNVDGDQFKVKIDQKDYIGSEYILNAATSPFTLKYVDNSESIYPPIKASEATMNFIAEEGFSFTDIVSSDDTGFRVSLYYIAPGGAESLQWLGFIDPDSCAEELLDAPKVLQLKATDGIGLLKNIRYRKVDTTDAYEFISCLNIITNCLYQTGILDIDLAVEVSLFNTGQDDRDIGLTNEPLVQTYMHTRSFMTSATQYDNCYNVLNSILQGFNATLFQAGGRWNIVRFPDKWQSTYRYATIYPTPWNIASAAPEWQHLINVNLSDVVPINADHQRRFIAAAEKAIVTYEYKIPDDLPRNKTWSRGDELTPPSWNFEQAPTYIFYDIDNWDLVSDNLGTPTIAAADTYFLRREEYDTAADLVEDTQYIIGEEEKNSNAVPPLLRARAERFRVGAGDYMNLSFETSAGILQTSSGSPAVAIVLLYADNGNVYSLSSTANIVFLGAWAQIDAATIDNESELAGNCLFMQIQNGTSWNTFFQCKIENQTIPYSGELEIMFLNWCPQPLIGNRLTFLRSFNFSIAPYIDGSRGIRGEEATVAQTQTRRQNAELEVKIGSSPRPYFNGTLFLADGETICSKWYTPNDITEKRLSEITALDLFRARYRLKTKVEGTLKGIMYEDPADTDYKTFISPYTSVRYGPFDAYIYLASNLDINFEDNTARVFLYEFYHSIEDNPIEPGDSQTFKYLYE